MYQTFILDAIIHCPALYIYIYINYYYFFLIVQYDFKPDETSWHFNKTYGKQFIYYISL